MNLLAADLPLFQLAGLLTHLAVFALGLGGVVGMVPLPRGRRSGLGLVLMALSMIILVVQPRQPLGSDAVAAAGHVGLFALALWLLIGPV